MRATPTYLIQKTVSSLDRHNPANAPSGFLYGTSRAIRDLPFSSPVGLTLFGTASALATGGVGAAIAAPFVAAGYLGASAYATAREVISAAPNIARFLEKVGRGKPEFSAPMLDTQASMSMRQASMRAIHDSGYMLNSVLGKEARLFHR